MVVAPASCRSNSSSASLDFVPHTEFAGFVAGRSNNPPLRRVTHRHRPTAEGRIVPLLDRRVKRITSGHRAVGRSGLLPSRPL